MECLSISASAAEHSMLSIVDRNGIRIVWWLVVPFLFVRFAAYHKNSYVACFNVCMCSLFERLLLTLAFFVVVVVGLLIKVLPSLIVYVCE